MILESKFYIDTEVTKMVDNFLLNKRILKGVRIVD